VLLNVTHTLNGIYSTAQNVKDYKNLITVQERSRAAQIKPVGRMGSKPPRATV